MDNQKFNNATWDDMVFEGHNKDYGAYVLRQLVNKNTLRAFAVTSVVFLLFVGASQLKVFKNIGKKKDKEVLLEMTDVEIEAPPPVEEAPSPPPPPPPPPPVRPTIKLVELIAKKDEEVNEQKVTKQEEIKETQISTKTIEGDKEAKASIIIPKEEGGKGPEQPQPQPEKPKEPVILTRAEVMPSFPGGPAELMKYLSKNINYPSLARENGLEGKVIVNFYVDTDGAIKNPTIVKDPVGGGCAEEALRVIKAMPKWSPGLQNGMPAKVYYTLPVTFKLQ